jgi:AraC-like DNA-binding protein
MLFRVYKPVSPLSDFIENFWIYEGFEPPATRERIFPSGTFEFVFNLRDDEMRIYEDTQSDECQRFSGAIVSGPHAASFVTETAFEASVMGVHFKPGGAFPFLGPAADELRDRHTDLEVIWGRTASKIRERLCETASPVHRFRVLDKFLLSRLFHQLEHHSAVALGLAILDRARSQTTRELAHEAGLSEKRFIDVFKYEVGLNPRLFHRIRRFQRVLGQVHQPGRSDWTQLALNHGFFDQSHLIRDFLAFSGFSPIDYVRRLEDLRVRGLQAKFNHLPVIE